jgi:ubiquinol-cytochrome c reductase cytochrome c subunit
MANSSNAVGQEPIWSNVLVVFDRRALGGITALVVIAAVGWLVTSGPLAAGGLPTGPSVAAVGPGGQVSGPPGKVIYDSSCAACHGMQGEGTSNGPALTDSGAASADFMLRTGRMPLSAPGQPVTRGRPAFSDADIQALVAYVASLGNGPPIPGVQVNDSSDLAAGRAAYIANCAACHGAGGSGDAVGGGFVAPPVLDTAPTQVGEAIRIGPGVMPVFDPNQISDKDLSSIAAYLASLRERSSPGGISVGGVGPVAEGYVAWLIYLTAFLLVVRWIERRRQRSDRPG